MRARALVAAQLYAGLLEREGDLGQERVGDGLVHEQCLGGVAYAGALGLRVEHDLLGPPPGRRRR